MSSECCPVTWKPGAMNFLNDAVITRSHLFLISLNSSKLDFFSQSQNCNYWLIFPEFFRCMGLNPWRRLAYNSLVISSKISSQTSIEASTAFSHHECLRIILSRSIRTQAPPRLLHTRLPRSLPAPLPDGTQSHHQYLCIHNPTILMRPMAMLHYGRPLFRLLQQQPIHRYPAMVPRLCPSNA